MQQVVCAIFNVKYKRVLLYVIQCFITQLYIFKTAADVKYVHEFARQEKKVLLSSLPGPQSSSVTSH